MTVLLLFLHPQSGSGCWRWVGCAELSHCLILPCVLPCVLYPHLSCCSATQSDTESYLTCFLYFLGTGMWMSHPVGVKSVLWCTTSHLPHQVSEVLTCFSGMMTDVTWKITSFANILLVMRHSVASESSLLPVPKRRYEEIAVTDRETLS